MKLLTALARQVTLWAVGMCLATASVAFVEASPDKNEQPAAAKNAPKKGGKKGSFQLPRPPKDFAPAALTVEEPVHDWGSIVRGLTVRHTFTVKNTGGSPLKIDRVKPQCGCTAVEKPEDPIAPGESAPITLSIDTKRFKGALKKTAQIFSNATPKPVVLTLQGDVQTLFTWEPENPVVEIIRGEEQTPFKITVRKSDPKQKAKVLSVSTKSTVVTPTLKELEPESIYIVDIATTLPPNNKRNYFHESLSLKVDSAGEVFDIPLRLTINMKDRIDVRPKSAYFPRKMTKAVISSSSQPIVKEVVVKSLGGPEHSFKITEVNVPPGIFSAKVQPIEVGKSYKVIVSVTRPPADNRRTVRSEIVLKTNDSGQPEIKVTALAIFGK